MARSLDAAHNHPDPIGPTYASPTCRKIAGVTWKLMKAMIKEADGRKLVTPFTSTKHVFEIWRLLWVSCSPTSAAIEAAEARRLLHPKQILNIQSVMFVLAARARRLAEFHEETGEEASNYTTRRESV